MTAAGGRTVDQDALADLRAVQAEFGNGALVLVQTGSSTERAARYDTLAADLTAAAISCAHAAAAHRRAEP